MPHWLVIDLEATTDEGGWPVTEMEIIEIGASLVDRGPRAGSLPALRQTDCGVRC
jgi:inhibitor of KinA sporulation pathway (predicted exonuclease)